MYKILLMCTYWDFFPCCALTILEPFLVQVRVRGGFPDHLQFKVTSEYTSTVTGLGSTTRIGPTKKKPKTA